MGGVLCPLKRPFVLPPLKLQPIVDTLRNDDVRPPSPAPEPLQHRAVAGRTSSRDTRVATPTAGAATNHASAAASHERGPLAVRVGVPPVDRGRTALVIVTPATVIAWHRRGFRLFWTWKSRRRTGRPAVPLAVRTLIRTMSEANPLWGAPRIHGELLKLGIEVGQASVAKYMIGDDSRHRKHSGRS